jgi:PPOX class probable F420-dependent enzyme
MPSPPLPDHVRELLAKPNPCVIATLRSDGQPVSVATWYLLDGDRVLVNMDEGRRRIEHLRNDPRVSLTVLDSDGWQTHVSLTGRVVELYHDEGLVDIVRISKRYLGSRFHNRERRRISARIEIERWHGWGAVTRGGGQ